MPLFVMAKEELARRINALPLWAREYIHCIEASCDRAGDQQTIADLRFQVECLQKRLDEVAQ